MILFIRTTRRFILLFVFLFIHIQYHSSLWAGLPQAPARIIGRPQPLIFSEDSYTPFLLGKDIEILQDGSNTYNAANIVNSREFLKKKDEVPQFLMPYNNVWGRFSIINKSTHPTILFNIQYPNISNITLFKLLPSGILKEMYVRGNSRNFAQRENSFVNFIFDLQLPPKDGGTYYFNIKSGHPVELRMFFSSLPKAVEIHSLQSIIMALYIGILLSML